MVGSGYTTYHSDIKLCAGNGTVQKTDHKKFSPYTLYLQYIFTITLVYVYNSLLTHGSL